VSLNVGTLVAYLQLDTDSYTRQLGDSENRLKRFSGGAIKLIAGIGSAFAALGAINFVHGLIDQASDLNESASKISQVFGDQASAIEDFAHRADKALGLSQQAALDAAAIFATFGKGAGLAGSALTDFSESSVKLAGDLASFFNTDPAAAAEAIGAAFRGETEPIRAYGVMLDEASVKAEAVRVGIVKAQVDVIALGKAQFAAIDAQKAYTKAVQQHGIHSLEAAKAGNTLRAAQQKLNSEVAGSIPDLTQQQKVLATQSAIIMQTSDAQGDFARTSSGLANQQRILNAEFTNAKAELGQVLLPYAKDFVSTLKDMVEWGRANKDWLEPTVGILAGLGATIFLVVKAIQLWTLAQWALNVAMDANPLGLFLLALAAIIAGVYLLWTNSAAFRDFFIGAWHYILVAAKAVGEFFSGPFVDFFKKGWHNFEESIDIVGDKIMWLLGMPGRQFVMMKNAFHRIGEALRIAFHGAINMVIRAWNSLDFGIHVHFPGWLPPPLGGKGIDVDDLIPDIPYLARGGVVLPRPGGTPVVMAETGQVEIASPEPLLRRIVREESATTGGGSGTRRIELWLHGDGVLRGIRATTRVQGGDPDVVLVGASN
jgi:hypothetical protein